MEDDNLKIENSSEEVPKAGLIKLSASSTKTFEQCRRKYYYTYIEKLPKKDWAHLTLGTFCHAVLQQFHETWMRDKNIPLVENLSQSFADQRPNYSSMTNEQLENAKDMLQQYLFTVEKHGMPTTLSVEESFQLTVGNYTLRGFIDRLDIDKDGLFHIVDYKTSKNEKYLDDFQLLVYGMAIKNKYPDMTKFRGSYVLLRKGSKMMTTNFTLDDIARCEKKIKEFGKRIEEEKKWDKSPSQLCNWCDFYDVCMGANNWI